MKTIVEVKGNKVYLDNGITIGLSNETIKKYDLRRRERLSDEEYQELVEIAALSTSYYLLNKRDYSKKELFQKLLLKYREKKIIEKVISLLEEKGYLDDMEYAKFYAKTHSYGKVKLQYNLRLKGIDRSIIEEVLNENTEDEIKELEKAWEKLKGKEPQKKIASLLRKGYKYSDIKKIMNKNKGDLC